MERFGLAQSVDFHEHAFGALDDFARFQCVFQIADFAFERPDFLEAGERQFDHRHQFRLAKWFDDVADDAGFFGAIDQCLIGVGG